MATPLTFRALLPPFVACAEASGALDESGLLGVEVEYATRMIAARRAEFAAGRRCARTALQQLGAPSTEIARTTGRAPIWPNGFVGSITHATGVAAAAVAPLDRLLGIGIDVEAIDRFHDDIGEHVCTAHEWEVLRLLDPAARQHAIALTFSAKECMHKLWAPAMGTTLPFTAVEIVASADSYSVVIVASGAAEPARDWRLEGRWAAGGGLVRTALLRLPH